MLFTPLLSPGRSDGGVYPGPAPRPTVRPDDLQRGGPCTSVQMHFWSRHEG